MLGSLTKFLNMISIGVSGNQFKTSHMANSSNSNRPDIWLIAASTVALIAIVAFLIIGLPTIVKRGGQFLASVGLIFNPILNNEENTTPAPNKTATTTETNDAENTTTPGTSPGDLSQGEESSKTYPLPGGQGYVAENQNGHPDLIPLVRAIGIVDSNNAFTSTSTIHQGQRGAVQFAVTNIGDKSSGEWIFAAVLPTYPSFTFNSEVQRSLRPGERVEYTLGFDSAQGDASGLGTITINVNPSRTVNESNYNNDIIRATIQVANP